MLEVRGRRREVYNTNRVGGEKERLSSARPKAKVRHRSGVQGCCHTASFRFGL